MAISLQALHAGQAVRQRAATIGRRRLESSLAGGDLLFAQPRLRTRPAAGEEERTPVVRDRSAIASWSAPAARADVGEPSAAYGEALAGFLGTGSSGLSEPRSSNDSPKTHRWRGPHGITARDGRSAAEPETAGRRPGGSGRSRGSPAPRRARQAPPQHRVLPPACSARLPHPRAAASSCAVDGPEAEVATPSPSRTMPPGSCISLLRLRHRRIAAQPRAAE